MQFIIERNINGTREWYSGNGTDGSAMWSDVDADAVWYLERECAEIAAEELGLGADAVTGFEV